MSHIAQIGRRSWRVRAGMVGLYALLAVGAVTTVYPFLLMVSIGTKSQTDYNDYAPSALLPRYLRDDKVLYAKYVEDRFANNLDDVNAAYNAEIDKVASVAPPPGADIAQEATLAADWVAFTKTLPMAYKKAGFGEHDNAPSALLLRYRAHLRDTFGDIDALNKAWTEENVGFDNVTPPFERSALREWMPDMADPKVADWTRFKSTLPPQFLLVTMADPLYRTYLRQDVYEDDLARLNAAWRTDFKTWGEITLPPTPYVEANAAQVGDWEKFVRTKFPLRMLSVNEDALPAWRQFLAKKKRVGAASARLPASVPLSGDARTDWMEFIARAVPRQTLTALSPENRWRYTQPGSDIGIVPLRDFRTPHRPPFQDAPPQALADWQYVQQNAQALRWDFATRNFKTVASYIFLHGAAVGNTALFCLLAIGGAIIVNPLCAYALSRYPLPYAYKVLLFLLATMAFPAEVAMIPNFLLIKDLGLLNTFGALVLPGLANGFSIFLLKGFFDSLPRELYEAGILDGATEIRMFQTITVPLSLPIFSVIALNAFTASYGAFLFAMVVCQDPKMWTLMVWLYNLQDTAPQYVIMAALTLAALPTLIVFLFAQKIIMRGVILPSFK